MKHESPVEKALVEVVNAHFGIGSLQEALTKALRIVININKSRYGNATIVIDRSFFGRIVNHVARDIGVVPGSPWYALMAKARFIWSCSRAATVTVPVWFWSAILCGPLGHVGLVEDQPHYSSMSTARLSVEATVKELSELKGGQE